MQLLRSRVTVNVIRRPSRQKGEVVPIHSTSFSGTAMFTNSMSDPPAATNAAQKTSVSNSEHQHLIAARKKKRLHLDMDLTSDLRNRQTRRPIGNNDACRSTPSAGDAPEADRKRSDPPNWSSPTRVVTFQRPTASYGCLRGGQEDTSSGIVIPDWEA